MSNHTTTPEADRIHFAVLAIEAGAKKLGISPAEMQKRLEKQDLFRKRILKFYDLLHTQSIDWVADDITETLQNWEAADRTSTEKGESA
ncbi:DUF3791 domain-containing protein [uncultured Bacteroides sp.]|uniref:DUF3791 domain-containing protein n=1 Tax=uncultured Bacteroides sp. TaxID=162156 RepID=UPI0023BE5A42|nr:DUF3791 domain-containing protein [uncultured Bacteroides sp.]MDE5711202.1 DUF3791 domain-containing protein [Bacteroides sp.]